MLEAETFTTSWTYDALSRVLTQTTPDASVTTQAFGPGGMLNSVAVNVRGAVTPTGVVTNIDYNARGQRTIIEYANGSATDYEYDPKTFRVTRIRTIRPNPDPALCIVQDLRYHYDPVGNIARIRDQAQQGVFFDNAYADPTQSFVYDGLYRLISATGREHATLTMPTAEGFAPIAHPQDTQAQRNYTQRYTYDPVGNILRMRHESGMSVVWQRGYAYHPGGNRLKATSDPLDDIDDPLTYTVPYTHDAHGNMTAMPNIPGGLTWDDDDRLQSSDSIGGGTTYYVYDGAGQRVRKVHVNQTGTTSKQRLYFGSWETYREHKNINTTNDLDLERETLHVHDDHGRVCLIETKTVDAGTPVVTPANIARYQYSNHLGTANLELDDVAEVISYEEFHPYGTSSYRAANSAIEVSAKRYRYTGQERDEETGLAYHGARYYAPWLARWTAVDPLGLADGPNRALYAQANPLRLRDSDGLLSQEPDTPAVKLAPGAVLAKGEVRSGESRRQFVSRVIRERFAGISPQERVVIESELPEDGGISGKNFTPGSTWHVGIPADKVKDFARRFEAVPLAQGKRLTSESLVEGGATSEVHPLLSKIAEVAAAAINVGEAIATGATLGLGLLSTKFARQMAAKLERHLRSFADKIRANFSPRGGFGAQASPRRPPTPPNGTPNPPRAGGTTDDAAGRNPSRAGNTADDVDVADPAQAGDAVNGAARRVVQRDPFNGWDPTVPIGKLLQGKGQIAALARNPNLQKIEGYSTEQLLQFSLQDLQRMLTKKQFKTIMKHFEGRDLRHGQ